MCCQEGRGKDLAFLPSRGGLAQPLLGLPAGAAEPCQQIRFKNVGATAWDRSGEPGMLLSVGQTHQQAIPPLKMIIF